MHIPAFDMIWSQWSQFSLPNSSYRWPSVLSARCLHQARSGLSLPRAQVITIIIHNHQHQHNHHQEISFPSIHFQFWQLWGSWKEEQNMWCHFVLSFLTTFCFTWGHFFVTDMHSTIIIAVLIAFKNLSSGLRKIWPPFCFFNSLATPLSHLPGPWVGQWRWWWWKSHCLSITHLSLIRLLSGDGRWGRSRHQCAACCWGETFRRSWGYFWSWRAFWEAGGGRGWRWRRGEENEERGGENGSNDTLAHFRQPELFGKPLKWSYSHIIVRSEYHDHWP